jgi:hypothetical protein
MISKCYADTNDICLRVRSVTLLMHLTSCPKLQNIHLSIELRETVMLHSSYTVKQCLFIVLLCLDGEVGRCELGRSGEDLRTITQ